MMKFSKSTDLEQAQRLLRCGVKESIADMSWRELIDPTALPPHCTALCVLPFNEAASIYGKDGTVPAWSLSALLAMMPSSIQCGKQTYHLDFSPYRDNGWHVGYFNDKDIRSIKGLTYSSDIIEACVRAIEWLCRNNYKLIDTTDEKTV